MPLDNIESPLMFTVTERPIEFLAANEHLPCTGWKALVRRHPKTGEPVVLHVAKDTYKVIQNRELFGKIDSTILDAAGDHSKGAIIKDSVSYLGAFCKREYLFPNMLVEIRQRRSEDTKVGFRVVASTSFDGSSSYKMLSGIIDYICTNGSVFGELDQFVRRHTGNQDLIIGNIGDRLKASVDVFWRHADVLKKWASKEITTEIAEQVLAKFGMSDARCKQIMIRFHYEADMRGPTVWALYSALTFYSSHNSNEFSIRDTGKDNVAATLQKRELDVFRLTNSPEWRQLSAA